MSDKADQRNKRILEAAVDLAGQRGFRNFSRDDVAEAAGVSAGLVNHAFGTMDALHDEVMAQAVKRRLEGIVAQGLALAHPAAVAAPPDLKQAAVASLAA